MHGDTRRTKRGAQPTGRRRWGLCVLREAQGCRPLFPHRGRFLRFAPRGFCPAQPNGACMIE
jgi:hypothetical protein